MKIIKYIFEAIFVYFLFLIVKILGLNLGRKIITALFLSFGFFFKSKKVVKKNISYALGKTSEEQIKNIIKSMWKNYAHIFAEYLYLYKFRLDKFSTPQIKISGKEILDDLIKSGRQAVFISGHFGNFELMAMELEKHKVNLGAIYRPLNNIFLNPNKNLVIVSFVDFNCTFCKKSDLVIRDLLKSNSDIIYLVKDFPILGELSLLAARASVSVMLHEVKNVHSEFVRNLMGIESEITMEKIRAIGLKSGVKSEDVFKYMYANEVDKIISSNFEIGRKLGLEGTPSFLINNKVYRGHIDSDNLKEIINTYRRQLSGN